MNQPFVEKQSTNISYLKFEVKIKYNKNDKVT